MVEAGFPGFRFVSESGGTYGFVREHPGYWYDYLPIDRYFESGKGDLSINWYLVGSGHVPDWYEWSGSYHTPWRVPRPQFYGKPDPNEPVSLLTSPGPDQAIRYQTGTQSDLPQALEVLEDKIRRYAIPALEQPLKPAEERRLRRWALLAEHILPRIELLAPEELEAVKDWQKSAARRWKSSPAGEMPPAMARWREEARCLPGFAEEWDSSPILQDWVFNWFTHALMLRP